MGATLTVQRTPTATVNVGDFYPDKTGATDSTAAFVNAWNALKALGGGTLYVPFGNYLTKDLLFQSYSNFTIRGDRGTIIWNSPNTTASPGQATHDVCIIADCNDFTVDGVTFDGRRDTIAGDQFLTANAASGQRNVTVQDGTKYVVGEAVSVFGGLTANSGNEKTFNDSNLAISSISGNVLTLSANLTHSYTGTGVSGGAWITQYQVGGVVDYSVAGRSLGNEDAQNGLHLINCQRFRLENVNGQNVWESPIKCGTGFAPTAPTDGCAHGLIMGCNGKHGYDQGISVWNSQYITVLGGDCTDAGWAGVSLSHCNDCDVIGPVCTNNVYSPPFDLNEGTGVAMEGCVRCTVNGATCSSNNSNGIRLNISPMFGGAALNQGVSGSLSAGATSITLTAPNSNFVNGASFTIVDPNNDMIRETIYCTGSAGAAVSISPGLRNNYASGPTIYGRFGEDCTVIGNNCALQALGAGIHADQQINLHVELNDCSKNGFLNGSFQDTQGTYGIHLHSYCQGALVKDNTCNFNAQEGMVIDNNNRLTDVVDNICNNNGIVGTNQKMGIKIYGQIDGSVRGNKCSFNTHSGIYTQDGNVTAARLSLVDNECFYNSNSGIWLDNGGNTVVVRGNKCAYNNDVNCKVLGYSNSIFELNQFYNCQGQEGLRFDDGNSSRFCTDNKVFDNLLFDDRGGNASQSWGFRELGNSARTVLRGSRTFGNTNAAQISIAPTSRIAPDVALDSNTHDSTVVGAFNAIMPSSDMQNATFNVWIDESTNALKFQVKYSNGTVKNGSILLI